jgi:transposase
MHRLIDGEDRMQQTLLPNSLEDYVGEENPVRVIEAFIEELDLAALGFSGMTPAATGRLAYHPSTLLKIYLYGYLNRLQSSRRLEREAQRNIELMWLAGRLAPDFKTIADFRKDNGAAIRAVCRQFVELCPADSRDREHRLGCVVGRVRGALFRPGRPSVPPEKLLRAMLLQAFYSVRSERQLMERIEFDLLFRWFVGIGIDDPVWDHSSFTKNRDRLLEGARGAEYQRPALGD